MINYVFFSLDRLTDSRPVGSCHSYLGCGRICHVSYLSWVNDSIQSVSIVQFVSFIVKLTSKRYIQMSGMVMGGMIDADRRIRDYEATVRVQRRMRIDRATWERYEKEFEEPHPSRQDK